MISIQAIRAARPAAVAHPESERIITDPQELAADITQILFAQGFDAEGYPIADRFFHRDEWSLIVGALQSLAKGGIVVEAGR